jgi:hypothetical protein
MKTWHYVVIGLAGYLLFFRKGDAVAGHLMNPTGDPDAFTEDDGLTWNRMYLVNVGGQTVGDKQYWYKPVTSSGPGTWISGEAFAKIINDQLDGKGTKS